MLTLTKRKNSPYWYVRGTYDRNKEIFRSTGILHGGLKRPQKEALSYLEKLKSSLDTNRDHTFGDAAKVYLQSGGSPRYLSRILEAFEDVPLANFDQSFIDMACLELYPNSSPASRNRAFYTPFIAVWNRASVGQNPMCPVVRWVRPKGASKLKQVRKPVSYADAVKFINALPPHAARLALFLFYTGARPLEAIELDYSNVYLHKEWCVLEKTKTGSPRGIPLHKCLLSIIGEGKGRVFRTQKGEPYSDRRKINQQGRIIFQSGGQFKTTFNRARKITGVDVTPYTARHTVATTLDALTTITKRNRILGHAGGISEHYVTTPQKELIEVINLLPDPYSLGLDPCIFRADE